MKSEKSLAEKFFYISASVAITIFIILNYGKLVFSLLGPFVLAYIGANIVKSPSRLFSERLKIPHKAACIFTVLTFYLLLFTLSFLGASRLVSELYGLLTRAGEFSSFLPGITERVNNFFLRDFPYSGYFESLGVDIWEGAGNLISSSLESMTKALAAFITSAFSFVPQAVFFIVVTVIASCYFAMDLRNINRFILSQMSQKTKVFFSECRIQFFRTTSKYLKATLTLSAITFTELFVGLGFIEGKFAFALSFIITLVDLLPILGTGSVLVPWAIFEFVGHNLTKGFGLLALYLAVSLVRQLLEPKIIGSYIGLNPLVTLLSVYIGLRFWGLVGVFVVPVIAILIKNLNEKGLLSLYKNPAYDKEETISLAREKYKKFRKKDNKQ